MNEEKENLNKNSDIFDQEIKNFNYRGNEINEKMKNEKKIT